MVALCGGRERRSLAWAADLAPLLSESIPRPLAVEVHIMRRAVVLRARGIAACKGCGARDEES